MSSTLVDLAIFGHPVLDEKLNQSILNIRGVTPLSRIIETTLKMMNNAWTNHETYRRMKETKFDIGLKIDDSLLTIYKKIEDFSYKLIPIGLGHCLTSSVSAFYLIITMNVLLENSKGK